LTALTIAGLVLSAATGLFAIIELVHGWSSS